MRGSRPSVAVLSWSAITCSANGWALPPAFPSPTPPRDGPVIGTGPSGIKHRHPKPGRPLRRVMFPPTVGGVRAELVHGTPARAERARVARRAAKRRVLRSTVGSAGPTSRACSLGGEIHTSRGSSVQPPGHRVMRTSRGAEGGIAACLLRGTAIRLQARRDEPEIPQSTPGSRETHDPSDHDRAHQALTGAQGSCACSGTAGTSHEPQGRGTSR